MKLSHLTIGQANDIDVELSMFKIHSVPNATSLKVKPSHLTTGQAVFVVDEQLQGRMVLPVGPGRKVRG